ncbi:MAG: STAS domain-containing protein [Planctomycetota bacterium]|jgi:anti-sigma B factor antagonist
MQATSALTIQRYQNIVLVAFARPRLTDAATIAEVGDAFDGIMARYPKISLILDFGQVAAMSSQMLGKLVALHKEVLAGRGRMVVCGVGKPLKPLFKVTKLDKLLDIKPDAQKMLLYYQRKPL